MPTGRETNGATLDPTVFMRGGTSKGLFFEDHARPPDPHKRDASFLAAMGSPDRYGRQLIGHGRRFVVLVEGGDRGPLQPHRQGGADYTFARVAGHEPVVDYASNCGNLASAVAIAHFSAR